MGWFTKKPDQLSARARQLNAEIAALEAQIKNLSSAPAATGRVAQTRAETPATVGQRPVGTGAIEPIFEKIDQQKLKSEVGVNSSSGNRLEVNPGRFDALVIWRRFQEFFRGPPPANPRLVNYLAAGGIHGLRPLRYEKRVARYRLVFLCGCLVFALWIIIALLRR